jgi:hypothetical protein
MKFLGEIQRILDLYNEEKPGGNIIINYQGRTIYIHIMQIGIDLENINSIMKSSEFLEKKENLNRKYKFNDKKKDNNEDKNNNSNKDNKDENEKYIFFSVDGLNERNKILIKFQSFDCFYASYLEKLENIKNPKNSNNMDKIIEENEEYINSCKSIIEVKPGVIEFNTNANFSINKNIFDNNNINNINSTNNININKNEIKEEIKEDISTKTDDNKTKEIIINKKEEKIVPERSKTSKNINDNINASKGNEIIKKKNKKIKIKKKGKKNKSKSGINLSHTSKDIQIDQKLNKEMNEKIIKKNPIFIQILKDSESKIMNTYNYKDETQSKNIEKNYNDIINLANEINKKYNREIIII